MSFHENALDLNLVFGKAAIGEECLDGAFGTLKACTRVFERCAGGDETDRPEAEIGLHGAFAETLDGYDAQRLAAFHQRCADKPAGSANAQCEQQRCNYTYEFHD
jgi:hypothetical protein